MSYVWQGLGITVRPLAADRVVSMALWLGSNFTGLGFRVSGSGFIVQCLGFRALLGWFRVWGRLSGYGWVIFGCQPMLLRLAITLHFSSRRPEQRSAPEEGLNTRTTAI